MPEDAFKIVGTTQGPYRVDSVVAEGGFGVVYRAYHDAFRAPVALKCLKVPGALSEKSQAEFLERFREEAEVMFRLSASIPAVVRPLHVDVIVTKAGQFVPFMALEWLEGETLDVVVSKRSQDGRPPLTLKRLVRMLTPVARALERAHNFPGPEGTVSIVHCDLKPDNIFLVESDGVSTAKILDFGIAKVRSAASRMAGRVTPLEASGENAFTPGYAAPEQWRPKRFGQTGPWTDVWGMAVTMVEAALGRPLIDGDHAAMMNVATDEQRRPTPRSEGLQVSDEVEEIFQRALAVDPRRRQADVGLFWDELERAFGLESTSASVVRRDHRAEGAGPAVREERVELGRKSYSSVAPPASSATLPSAGIASASQPPPHDFRPSIQHAWPAPVASAVPGASMLDGRAAEPPPSSPRPSSSPRLTEGPASQRRFTPPPISSDPPAGLSFGGEVELGDDDPGQHIALDLDPLALQGPGSSRRSFDGRVIQHSMSRPPIPARSSSGPDLKTRLALPLRLAIAGIGIAVVEQAYIQILDGDVIALGPVRLIWIASAITLVGTVMVLFRVFWPSEE